MEPLGDSDLRLTSPQTDISLHCKTTDTWLVHLAVCLFASQVFAGTHCTYPQKDGQAELTWVVGCTPRRFARSQMVTDPRTNRARHTATMLTKTSVWPSLCG